MGTVFDAADYFLASQDLEAGDCISNMKLQKLCYYAQGFALVMAGGPLFSEEIQAWMHGPVCPVLYHAFKKYGNGAIPLPERSLYEICQCFTPEQKDLLGKVWRVYGQYSAWKLRDFTHKEKPWLDAVEKHPFAIRTIPLSSMEAFFKTMVE